MKAVEQEVLVQRGTLKKLKKPLLLKQHTTQSAPKLPWAFKAQESVYLLPRLFHEMRLLNKHAFFSFVSSQPSYPVMLSVQCLAVGTRKLSHYTTTGSASLNLHGAIYTPPLEKKKRSLLPPKERALIPTSLIFH